MYKLLISSHENEKRLLKKCKELNADIGKVFKFSRECCQSLNCYKADAGRFSGDRVSKIWAGENLQTFGDDQRERNQK